MPTSDDSFDFDADPPRPGDKLRFTGTRPFWFADMCTTAERELRVGEVYTLKTVRQHSSWTEVTLEETGELSYNDAWFRQLLASPNA